MPTHLEHGEKLVVQRFVVLPLGPVLGVVLRIPDEDAQIWEGGREDISIDLNERPMVEA